MGKLWYYARSGERRGPVGDKELKALADRGELRPEDLVWTEGLAEWKPAQRVNGLFPSNSVEPPPLPALPALPVEPPPRPSQPGSHGTRRIADEPIHELPEPLDEIEDGEAESRPRQRGRKGAHDVWAWALVAVPVVGAVIELAVGRSLLFLYLLLNAAFAFIDEKTLKAAGHRAPSGWWAVLLVPVYLWRRGTLLQNGRLHFAVWMASFVVSLALTFTFDHNGVEDGARPLVTQIIREQLGGTAKCVRVKVTENMRGGYYKAIATLDNGRDLQVMIEVRGDMMYVTVPR